MIVDTKKATRRWPFPNVWWSWRHLKVIYNLNIFSVLYVLFLVDVTNNVTLNSYC